jgi:hypothetical protein
MEPVALQLFILSRVIVDGSAEGICQPPEDLLSGLLSSQICVMEVKPSKKSDGMESKLLSSRKACVSAAMPWSVGMAPVKALKLSSSMVRLASWFRVGVTVPVRLALFTRSCTTLPALSHTTCLAFQEQGSLAVHPSVSLFVIPALKASSTTLSDAASPSTLTTPSNAASVTIRYAILYCLLSSIAANSRVIIPESLK